MTVSYVHVGLVGGLQLGLLNYFGQSLLFAFTGALRPSAAGRVFMLSTPSALLNPLRMNTLNTAFSVWIQETPSCL